MSNPNQPKGINPIASGRKQCGYGGGVRESPNVKQSTSGRAILLLMQVFVRLKTLEVHLVELHTVTFCSQLKINKPHL